MLSAQKNQSTKMHSEFVRREFTMKHQFWSGLCVCTCLLTVGGVLLAQPSLRAVQPANQAAEKDDPSKGSQDVDKTVAYPMAKVLEAAKQALNTYGCDVKKEKPDYLECTRDRHVGAFVGSGGEKVTVQLSVKGSETRVEIKTGRDSWAALARRIGRLRSSTK